MKKIVFMGTPEFSVPILEALIKDPALEIVAVVTQPDRKVGRKRKLTAPPVKKLALKHDLLVLQPEKLSASKEMEEIINLKADLIVTAAYGQYLPTKLLKAPKYHSINVHASLLPKYRGAAPIHYALLKGEEKTGVTIMYMEKEMDAGNIISQAEIKIEDSDDTGSLFEKLSILGRDLLIETLPKIFAGNNESIPQDQSKVTFSPMISKEEEKINWENTATDIYNHIRALRPAPGAYTILDGDRFKIWDAKVVGEKSSVNPGEIVEVDKDHLWVATGKGQVVSLLSVQPSGKKRLNIEDYLSGSKLEIGDRFGE